MSKQHVGRPRTISNDFLITYGILNILGLGGYYIRASSKLFSVNPYGKFEKERNLKVREESF